MYLRLIRRFVLMNAFEDEGGGGGAVVDAPPATAPAVASAAPAAEPAAAPKSMLDAINEHFDKPADTIAGQPRDEKGRFAPTAQEQAAADAAAVLAAQPGAKPAIKPPEPVKPAAEDPLRMPEGLGAKAQERFQALANSVKERDEKIDTLSRQVSYVRESFETHGVKQEQFEQAVEVIGMLNRGDLRGAKQVLEDQLRHVSLALGESVTIDPLANFPDLRNAVDQMQVTEAHALEIARGRFQQNSHQTLQTRQREQQEHSQQQQQAFEAGQRAVDEFCKGKQSTDLDYAAIEAQLVPEIPKLLAGVPPQAWRQIVETQYRLMKQAAGSARQASGSSSVVLRPTGSASPQSAPKTAFEAMWGSPAPA